MPTQIDPDRVMPRVILEAANFRGARVLEVGSGDGRLTFQYAQEAGAVIGIDIKEGDVRAARQTTRPDLAHVHSLCSDAAALPFRSGHFDIVLLASAL